MTELNILLLHHIKHILHTHLKVGLQVWSLDSKDSKISLSKITVRSPWTCGLWWYFDGSASVRVELDKSLEVSTRLRSNTGLYAKRTWKGFSLSTSCSAVRVHGPSTQQVGMWEVCSVSQEMRGREECSPLHGDIYHWASTCLECIIRVAGTWSVSASMSHLSHIKGLSK